MADVSDEAIKKSLEKVISDLDQTNWFSITYADGSTDRFNLCSVGVGGLAELRESLTETFQGYAYLRFPVQGSKGSAKFILIQFVGEKCTAFQKARVIVHNEDVLTVLKPANVEIYCASKADLVPEKIQQALISEAEKSKPV